MAKDIPLVPSSLPRIDWPTMQPLKPRFLVILSLALLLVPALFAQSPGPSPGLPSQAPVIILDDPAPLLGMTLGEAWARFGPPVKVAALRGDSPWQDDVAFVYSSGYALSWAGDRLWQIHFSQGYAGSVYGIFLGDGAEKLVSTLGTPYFSSETSLVFRLAWKGFPVRLRASLSQAKVSDLFVYRADF